LSSKEIQLVIASLVSNDIRRLESEQSGDHGSDFSKITKKGKKKSKAQKDIENLIRRIQRNFKDEIAPFTKIGKQFPLIALIRYAEAKGTLLFTSNSSGAMASITFRSSDKYGEESEEFFDLLIGELNKTREQNTHLKEVVLIKEMTGGLDISITI
jgi:hypothetical protein